MGYERKPLSLNLAATPKGSHDKLGEPAHYSGYLRSSYHAD